MNKFRNSLMSGGRCLEEELVSLLCFERHDDTDYVGGPENDDTGGRSSMYNRSEPLRDTDLMVDRPTKGDIGIPELLQVGIVL